MSYPFVFMTKNSVFHTVRLSLLDTKTYLSVPDKICCDLVWKRKRSFPPVHPRGQRAMNQTSLSMQHSSAPRCTFLV